MYSSMAEYIIENISNEDSIDIDKSTKLTELRNINNVNYISANGCINLTKISGLKNIKKLMISMCYNLEEIPIIDGLEELYCEKTSIKKIPYMKNLKVLVCNNCNKLDNISQMDKLNLLECSNCKLLKNSDIYHPNLKVLECQLCTHITEIPKIKTLQRLCCSNTYITKLPKLPSLMHLNVFNCKLLEEIPLITNKLVVLNCMKCIKLKYIYQPCKLLYIDNNRLLLSIDYWKLIYIGNRVYSKVTDLHSHETSCAWLYPNKIRINKLVRLQEWIRSYIFASKIESIIPIINKLYYKPGMKGYYVHKMKYDKIDL